MYTLGLLWLALTSAFACAVMVHFVRWFCGGFEFEDANYTVTNSVRVLRDAPYDWEKEVA